MICTRIAGVVLLIAGFVGTFAVTDAFADSVQEIFNKGVNASRQGDHLAAISAFEMALANGMETPALHYNLGSTYYRLGNYDKSKSAFQKLLDHESLGAVAAYNLGLIAVKEEETALAIQYFRKTLSLSDDKQIRRLSQTAIDRLQTKSQTIKEAPKPVSKWDGLVSAAVVNDSNVGLVNEELQTATGISDSAFELMLVANRMILGDREDGFQLSVLADSLNYQDERISNAYNIAHYQASIRKLKESPAWNSRFEIGFANMDVGGENFQQFASLELHGKRYIDEEKYVRVSYTFMSIDANDRLYQPLDGIKQKIKFDVTIPYGRHIYRYGFETERNDREDAQNYGATGPAIVFGSYSPTRTSVRMTYFYYFLADWRLKLDGQFRTSRYSEPDIVLASAGAGETSYTRVDNRRRFKVELNYNINRNWQLSLLYDYKDNDSNRLGFVNGALAETSSYNRHLYSASVIWIF